MTRGNQREKAREANNKKLAASASKQTGNPQQRREADAKALADKIAEKAALKEAIANGTAPPTKKITKTPNPAGNIPKKAV